MRHSIAGLFLCLLVSGCTCFKQISTKHRLIPVGSGPEDLVFDMENRSPRLIVSCAERNKKAWPRSEFWTVDLATDASSILPISGLPDSIELHAHGIDLGISMHGKTLFVVNHEGCKSWNRQSILLFQILSDSLRFVDAFYDDMLTSPNDVCFDGVNGIFVSNDSRKAYRRLEQLLFKSSYVLHLDLKTGQWTRAVDEIGYANGVGVNNGKLYVSGVCENGIKVYEKNNGEWQLQKSLGSFKGVDNLTFYGDTIYTTAHPKLMKFAKHAFDHKKSSPGQIYSVDTKKDSSAAQMIFEDDGTVMSAPSTAFRYGENMYVAQVFRPYILKLNMKAATGIDEQN